MRSAAITFISGKTTVASSAKAAGERKNAITTLAEHLRYSLARSMIGLGENRLDLVKRTISTPALLICGAK